MRATRAISTTAVFLLLGFTVPAYAGQEKQEEKAQPPKQEQQAKPEKQQQAKPEQQQHAQQQAKPQQQHEQQQAKSQQDQQQKQQHQKQQQAQADKQQQAKGQQEQQQEQAKTNKQQQQHTQQQAKGQQQQHGQQNASSKGPQRTQEAMATQHAQPELRLSDRGSGRIPDERFRSNFGRGHRFRMGNPVMVDGYSRFQYGGYWFGYVQPWPAGWYYTDDFYIDYVDGGYYMYDPYYPGARFAITVVI